jgi:hypothetical protein
MSAEPAATVSALLRRAPRLMGQLVGMACLARDLPYREWPAWSTGEVVAVALILNRADVLHHEGYTALQAIEAVSLDAVTLRALQRQVLGY